MEKIYYASTEDRSQTPCSLELLVQDGKVLVRTSDLKQINGSTVVYKSKWSLTALMPTSLKGKPANLSYKLDNGYYNAIKFRGRVLNIVEDAKKLKSVGPRDSLP